MKEKREYTVLKALNNNVILAKDINLDEEIVLVGKGIGFGKRDGNVVYLNKEDIEKTFYLSDPNTKTKYEELMNDTNKKVIGVSEEIIAIAEREFGTLNPNIHIALADHIGFSLERIKMGLEISNPFIYEIKALYPREYEIGEIGQEIIKDRLMYNIPESEVGFIALHIHSARENKLVIDAIQDTKFLMSLINIIEEELPIRLDNSGLIYSRLINHLRAGISRMEEGKHIENPLLDVIKEKFIDSYVLAEKIGAYISKEKNIHVTEDELGYIALHIERIKNSNI